MSIESVGDLAAFFDADDFGIEAILTLSIGKRKINGIFEDPKASRSVTSRMDVNVPDPSFTCRTSDVSEATEGDTLKINLSTYTIRAFATDGTGVSILQLEEQS